ncbi:MAG: hypothetical protein ONB44_03970 [candidate division KSB1 bacterium]|nr:hypothetical protein [candidate division KSB1 bacterium]MDZ7301287.1 hypothetical protein [candidate division KSB1 bacterium]MDZ7310828.1 hypothetical protein [candidate division KSB1 bacterium]
MISLSTLPSGLLQRDNLILVRRLPSTKTLYTNLLGLTFGLMAVFLASCLNYTALFNNSIWLALIAVATFSFFTYYLGVFFVILAAMAQIFLSKSLVSWYLWGYALGWILAALYNALAYFHLKIFDKKYIKIAFAYDTKKHLNIIKSPNEKEEAALLEALKPIMFYVRNIEKGIERHGNAKKLVKLIRQAYFKMPADDQISLVTMLRGAPETNFATRLGVFKSLLKNLEPQLATGDSNALELIVKRIEPLVEKYLKLKESKLYNYHIEVPRDHPYTIVFVANPQITRGDGSKIKDLIMNDRKLFLRSVNQALMSFERDEVSGRPEIWSRVRVITIFDENLLNASDETASLVEEFLQGGATFDGQVAENLISPHSTMVKGVEIMLERYKSEVDSPIPITDVDVIFALTASLTHIRSTAYYSDWDDASGNSLTPPNTSNTYQYDPDPGTHKGSEINTVPNPTYAHDDYAAKPGRAAVNVLSATRHTFIHEFAHAMSSAACGAICDEYYDKSLLKGGTASASSRFYVNRIERVTKPNGQIVPVHHIFAEYQHTVFHSDLDHLSAEENWTGYFPEKHHPNLVCTMDRTVSRYRFDKLISRFMYDRLVAKVNR